MPRIIFLEQDELPRVYDALGLVASKLRHVVSQATRVQEAREFYSEKPGNWRQIVKDRIDYCEHEMTGKAYSKILNVY